MHSTRICVCYACLVHEWSRDWKRLAANGATGTHLQQLRYRYVLALPLHANSATLLKGGLPLDLIAETLACIHEAWAPVEEEKEAEQTVAASADANIEAGLAAVAISDTAS